MKGAPENFRSWLKKNLSNKLSDDIKKNFPLTSTRKVTKVLVESDKNFYFIVQPYGKFVKVPIKCSFYPLLFRKSFIRKNWKWFGLFPK